MLCIREDTNKKQRVVWGPGEPKGEEQSPRGEETGGGLGAGSAADGLGGGRRPCG